MIMKPIYQASFPHPEFLLPKALLITAGVSTNNLLNVSFAEPENTPSDLPAGLGPDARYPHSCLDCVLCSGWVIPAIMKMMGNFFLLNPVLYQHIVKSQRTAYFNPLYNCTIVVRGTYCHSPTWGTLAHMAPWGWQQELARRDRSPNLPCSSILRSGRLWDRDGLWFFFRNLLSSLDFPVRPIRSHSWKSIKQILP